MKYILFSFLIISSIGYGQSIDSIAGYANDVIMDGTIGTDGKSLYVYEHHFPDTVKCVMLVSDLSVPNNNKVVWLKGYMVKPPANTISYDGRLPEPEYLDAIKTPLRKNITVWMSKELK
jgi:hypothetical protein